MRECGLKLEKYLVGQNASVVTPCAGVWIEISTEFMEVKKQTVTPCAGVWIEITML